MKRFAIGLLCALSLALVPACGGDDDGDATDGAGADAAGGGGDAAAFCAMYDDVCGFGTGYASQAACETAFNGYSATRQACVDEHLGLADTADDDSADEEMHCGHAAGASPCT